MDLAGSPRIGLHELRPRRYCNGHATQGSTSARATATIGDLFQIGDESRQIRDNCEQELAPIVVRKDCSLPRHLCIFSGWCTRKKQQVQLARRRVSWLPINRLGVPRMDEPGARSKPSWRYTTWLARGRPDEVACGRLERHRFDRRRRPGRPWSQAAQHLPP